MISEELKNKLQNKDNWIRYSDRVKAWSFYQEELCRIKCKYPNGFKIREAIINVLDENKLDETLWDFFVIIMIWGGRDEANFNKYEEQEDKIKTKLKYTYSKFSKCSKFDDIEEVFNSWQKEKITGLDISFFTKILYFLGLKFKENFKNDIRPLIYDSVMTKNVAFIFLDFLYRNFNTNNSEHFQLYHEYRHVLDLKNFAKNKSRNIKLMNPHRNFKSYKKYCEYLNDLSKKLDINLDELDEIIFGVNFNELNNKQNFRNYILNHPEFNKILDLNGYLNNKKVNKK